LRIKNLGGSGLNDLTCSPNSLQTMRAQKLVYATLLIMRNFLPKSLIALLSLPSLAVAQYYQISTIAGSGKLQFNGAGGPATSARLVQPQFVVADAAGNVVVSDSYFSQVFSVAPNGTIKVVAGTGTAGFSGGGGPATAAQLDSPAGLVLDSSGNLYIADQGNNRVRRVTPAGIITSIAGNGNPGVSGDGGPATTATVGQPQCLAFDTAGNLYISQPNDNVVRVMSPDGKINTFAGNGKPGFGGDGGRAVNAMFFAPTGLATEKGGSVYVVDRQNDRVRKIDPQGVITTVAGIGKFGFTGDGGLATSATLSSPVGVALASDGTLYISDTNNNRIRAVSPSSGIIKTVAGGGTSFLDGSASLANLELPFGISIDRQDNLLMGLFAGRQVRRMTPAGAISSIAGLQPAVSAGDNIPAASAPLLDPWGVTLDAAGNVYIADYTDSRIREVSPAGAIGTFAGNGLLAISADGTPATLFGIPRGVAFDKLGNLYATSGTVLAVYRITPNGILTRVAGGGPGFSGASGTALSAALRSAYSLSFDPSGNFYISETTANRIWRVNPAGAMTVFAGTGQPGYSGDGGAATNAVLTYPYQVAFDAGGSAYIADSGNHCVRKVSPDGTITTIAGTGILGISGDGGPAASAQLSSATGLAFDASGNLYLGDGARVRRIDASTGIISTIAGTGQFGFSGDGGLATNATLSGVLYLFVDSSGSIYLTDQGNFRIRKLTPAQIVPERVVNGATLISGAVAPGEVAIIYGGGFGPAGGVGPELDSSGRVANQLGGTQVMFDGVAAPILFADDTQVKLVVPYEVAGQVSTQIQAILQGKPTNTITVPVTDSSPGVFAIANGDLTPNSISNPAAAGSTLVLYGTGEGVTSPASVDGALNDSVLPTPILPVSVQIGGQNAPVVYAGAAQGLVAGMLEVDVQIPQGLTGSLPLQLTIGDASTPAGLTVYVSP
jgi:uncharacterized protein (TIGR03437 family)